MTSTEEDFNNQVGRMISFVDVVSLLHWPSLISSSETMNKMVMVTMIELVNELINMNITQLSLLLLLSANYVRNRDQH